MGKKLIGTTFIGFVALILGCSGGNAEQKKDAYLDAPSVPPVTEAKAQQDRGISPEVARGMAELGLAGKR